MDYISHYDSPLGGITLASDGKALTGLWFDGQARFGSTLGKERTEKDLPVFREALHWLNIYFSGKVPDFTPPLAPAGTIFRRTVWRVLLTIPYGETITYGALAERISKETGRPTSARAVGGAVGTNPISLIIPCHRVLGADGRLTGYAGGLTRKAALLTLERGSGPLTKR